MAIKVTPYIDTTSEVNKTTTPATNQVSATEELSFKEMLASEQQAQRHLLWINWSVNGQFRFLILFRTLRQITSMFLLEQIWLILHNQPM